MVQYDLDRSIIHPKFDPTGIRTHDLQIMNNAFHVPDTPPSKEPCH